jgi:hypothetical protein
MRTTVTLDDKTYEFTSHYATAKGITLGAAIGELVERAQAKSSEAAKPRIRRAPDGFPLLPKRGTTITSEMVKQAQEDEFE